MSATLFCTGLTGFVAKEVVRRRLEREPGLSIIGLIRAVDEEHLSRRRERILSDMFGDRAAEFADRVTVVKGDLTADRMKLSDEDEGLILERATEFLHCGASVSFDDPLDRARAINLHGSEKMAALAQRVMARGQLTRFDYVGTAYVAGERTDVVLEDELNDDYGFRNSYEQSKWESEQHMRELMGELPITIFRPSIIVGDSQTGRTTSFNVIYWPLRIFATGRWPLVIGHKETPVDVVPVDFVAEAMLHIARRDDSLGRCYHLAAGTNRDSRVEQIVELAAKFFDRKLPRFVTPEFFFQNMAPSIQAKAGGAMGQLIQGGAQYLPYFSQNPRFDTRLADEALADMELKIPRVEDYFDTLLRYCVDSHWGRKAI